MMVFEIDHHVLPQQSSLENGDFELGDVRSRKYNCKTTE